MSATTKVGPFRVLDARPRADYVTIAGADHEIVIHLDEEGKTQIEVYTDGRAEVGRLLWETTLDPGPRTTPGGGAVGGS